MSKRRRTNPNNKFVMLERWFWRCEAWQALPHPARSLYIELEMLYTGSNNGELFLSIRDAAKLLHTGARQAQAAFQALEAGGFIRATRKGSRTRRGEQRLATCWRLTKHADDVSGTPASSDFMKPRKNPTVSPEDIDRIPRGYGTPENDPQNTPDRIPRGHAQAAFEGTTVSPGDTHLV
jgi:DNA-binding transcriptional MocR family regulator